MGPGRCCGNPKHQNSWSERLPGASGPEPGLRTLVGPVRAAVGELASRPCRTRRDRCTTPTRTSWSRPTGCIPTSTRATRERFPLVWTDANEDTTPLDAVEQADGDAPRPGVPRRRRGADHVAQELPRDRLVPERRPRRRRSICSGSRASSCSTRSRARTSLRFDRDGDHEMAVTLARAQHRAVLDWCSVDPRLLPVTVVPVGDMAAAVALTREAIDGGQRGDLDRAVPGRSLAEPRRARTDVGGVRGSGRSGRAARRGRGRERDVARLLRQRPAARSRLPRRRHELQVDRLPVDPAAGHADAERVDHRRRADALSGVAHRRDRARRHVGAGLDALARLRARGVPQERGRGCRRWICGRASTCSARCASRRTRTRTPAGRSRTPAPTCACSRPTSRTSKAVAIRSRVSSAAWTRPGSMRRRARTLLRRQLRRPARSGARPRGGVSIVALRLLAPRPQLRSRAARSARRQTARYASMPSGESDASGPLAIGTRSGTLPHTATFGLGPRRRRRPGSRGVGARRADDEPDRHLARDDVEHRFDPRGLDAADAGRHHDDVGALDAPSRAGARCRAECRRPRPRRRRCGRGP